jgi:hypothetical protein
MMDMDLGEMFLNFPLHEQLRPYCGIDLRPFFPEEAGSSPLWEHWERCMMGLKSSPYVTIKTLLLGYESVVGDRTLIDNPFHWSSVKQNLPGTPEYDPTMPWVYRVNANGNIAGIVKTYVDDLRPKAESESAFGHRAASLLQFLEIQVSSRKTRPPSQSPGAWAGTVAVTGDKGVGVHVSQEKWNKAQQLVASLLAILSTDPDMDRRALESARGFFIHLQRTYPALSPFLKGIHLTVDGWREGRDSNKWKQPSFKWDRILTYNDEGHHVWTLPPLPSTPDRVDPAPQLQLDLCSLETLFAPHTPPTRFLHPTTITMAVYGFVDASGTGFGSSFCCNDGSLCYRHGVWRRDADHTSSNYKELRNLVEALEGGLATAELSDSEVFIFTDNSTVEGAFYKGHSNSKLLFDLILRLRQIEMSGTMRLHVVHVSGSRMIQQGTDGLSRGDVTEGVMQHIPMLSYIPLHLHCIQRSPQLLSWVQSWCPDPNTSPLTPSRLVRVGAWYLQRICGRLWVVACTGTVRHVVFVDASTGGCSHRA